MRHTIVTCGVLVLLTSGHALAGTLHFNPPSATITPGTQSVSFDVSVSWETLPTIDTVNVLIIANYGVGLHFDYAQSFLNSTTLPPPPPVDNSWFCDFGDCLPNVGFGGNNFAPSGWTSALMVGTLQVDTSGLLPGEHVEVAVDPEWEANLVGSAISLVANGASQDPLSGLTTITVVPEPTIAGFMAFVLCATMLQRKQVFA